MSLENKPQPQAQNSVAPEQQAANQVSAKPSHFDPASLRLSPNFATTAGVKKILNTVPVQRAANQTFIRTHPDPAFWLETAVLENKEDKETFLVDPGLWPELSGDLLPKVLVTSMTRQGVLYLWPIRLPAEDGRLDPWNTSALQGAEMAKSRWIRLQSNRSLGAYELFEATGNLPEPEWPEETLAGILKIAFRGHYIDSLDHSILRRLRGEV